MHPSEDKRDPVPLNRRQERRVPETRAGAVEKKKEFTRRWDRHVGDQAITVAPNDVCAGATGSRTGKFVADTFPRVRIRAVAVAIQIHLNMNHSRRGGIEPVTDSIRVVVMIIYAAALRSRAACAP